MKTYKILYRATVCLILVILCCNCSPEKIETTPNDNRVLKILALGDSYTKGESVCTSCNFPIQLRDSINKRRKNTLTTVRIIAQTGWTTYNLKNGINQENVPNDYDLVTLLIGVNNQYQNQPFSLYQTEFPELVQTAIQKAKGDKTKVIVVSIPDYAFTPYGGGNPAITNGLLPYNQFAADYCAQQQITFVNITDITQLGLLQPNLVASDGLHPSTLAYTKFVERILPFALEKLDITN